jgi:Nucleotide-sugar transporter
LQVLVAGVILITLNGSSPGAGGPNSGTREDYDLVVGLGASAASGLSSAYAGVYFEK